MSNKKNSIFSEEEAEESKETVLGEEVLEKPLAEIEKEISDDNMWDIFQDYGAVLQSRGDKVKYTIKRNGEYVGTVDHPYSYEDIKRKWGGGTYQVTLRSSKLNRYIKSQTHLIADESKEEKEKPAERDHSMELLTLLQTLQKQNRDESRAELERIREESKLEREAVKQEQASQMMLMMKMMETQAAQQQSMITALISIMANKNDNKSDKMFDMIVDLLANKQNRGESIDSLKLTELVREAEERGYQRARELRAIAEEEAERLAEMRGDYPEKESTTSTILKSVAPVFARLAAVPMAQPPTLPKAPVSVPKKVDPPIQSIPKIVFKPDVKPDAKKEKVMDRKQIVTDIAIGRIKDDLLTNFISGKFAPEATADRVLQDLSRFSIDAKWLYSNFTLQDMIDIARAKGMPDKINQYLERFYAHIASQATVGDRKTPEDNRATPLTQ